MERIGVLEFHLRMEKEENGGIRRGRNDLFFKIYFLTLLG